MERCRKCGHLHAEHDAVPTVYEDTEVQYGCPDSLRKCKACNPAYGPCSDCYNTGVVWDGRAFEPFMDAEKAALIRKERADMRMWVFDQLPRDVRDSINAGVYINPDAAITWIVEMMGEVEDLDKVVGLFRDRIKWEAELKKR